MARVQLKDSFFTELTSHKGDLVYLEVFGQPIILLNSPKAAKDLLEQRSAIYSDRPPLVSENIRCHRI
jgi:hypothetical protein